MNGTQVVIRLYTQIYKKGLRYEITQRNMLQLLLMAAKCGIVLLLRLERNPRVVNCIAMCGTPLLSIPLKVDLIILKAT